MTGLEPNPCYIDLFPGTYKKQNNTVDMFPRMEVTYKNNYGYIPANGQKEKHTPDIKMSLSFHVKMIVTGQSAGIYTADQFFAGWRRRTEV